MDLSEKLLRKVLAQDVLTEREVLMG